MQITANLIGVRVSWRVSDYLGARETVEQAITDAGLNAALLPRNTLKKAVGRASKAVSKASNGRFDEALPPRKLTDNVEKAVYALVRENVDESTDHAEYQQETTVRIDKAAKTVHAVGAQAEEFRAKFSTFSESVTDDDVRLFAKAVVRDSSGISYNPHGHDYFVPEKYQENMERLDAFLRNLKVGKMYITPAIDDPRSLEVTWERAAEQIDGEIDQVMANVDRFEKKVKFLHDKTDKLEALREMANLYGGMTERAAMAEEIAAKINAAIEKVAKKIEEIEASR
jgi:hypothetical protein